MASYSTSQGVALLELFTEVAWNGLVERFEPPFKIKKREPNLQKRLAECFRYALESRGQAQLSVSDGCEDLDILKAFRHLVKDSPDEHAVVALSGPGNAEPFLSIFASKGTATHVSIPESARRQIGVRVEQAQRTRVLYVHNHPRAIVHDIFGVDAIGPSTLDRDTLTREYKRWLDTRGLIESEFYLVEGGRFRKFIVPSTSDAWAFVSKFGATT